MRGFVFVYFDIFTLYPLQRYFINTRATYAYDVNKNPISQLSLNKRNIEKFVENYIKIIDIAFANIYNRF